MARDRDCFSCAYRRMNIMMDCISCGHDGVVRMRISPTDCEPCEYYKSDEESEGDDCE